VLIGVAKLLMGLVMFSLALLAGWVISQGLFSLTGRPAEPFVYLIAAILGLALFACTSALLAHFVFDETRRDLGINIREALERIAQGDFSVRIEPHGRHPLGEVVASVNQMAAELGTVEQQRQDFIEAVSHEIQSPVTSIGGFAALLRDPDLDEATRRHYLDVIQAESTRLSKLGDNLLRLTTLDDTSLDVSSVRVDQQWRSVLLFLEPQWAAKTLDVVLEAAPVTVQADAELLRQVWLNLLQNAIKFTPVGGHIWVRVAREGDMCRCQVADTGVGIQPADVPRLFERFFRADKARSTGGNGLGLALAKRIVDLHHGTIQVDSQPAEIRAEAQPGAPDKPVTIFTVDIPLTSD
jgi:signal transduction histidine kinase